MATYWKQMGALQKIKLSELNQVEILNKSMTIGVPEQAIKNISLKGCLAPNGFITESQFSGNSNII